MRTCIYIDGFNLYYGALKNSVYKWLDPAKMCRKLLKATDTIEAIKYFTAEVAARPHDPDQPVRQQTYLRALRTIPNLEIILGHFLTKPCIMPLVTPLPNGTAFVRV